MLVVFANTKLADQHFSWWVLIGCEVLLFTVTYELFLLGLFAGVVWGVSALLTWILPDSWSQASSWQATLLYFGAIALVIFVLGEIKDLKTAVRNAEYRIAQLQDQIDRSILVRGLRDLGVHKSDD